MSSIQKKKYYSVREKEKNVIGRRIAEARKMKGVSCSELSRILLEQGTQISSQVINKWENAYAVPTGYQLIALCYALDIEDGLSFFTGNYKPDLNTEGIKKVQEYRDLLVASGMFPFEERKMGKIIQMPVSPIRASAGTGNYIDEADFEMTEVDADDVPAGADFGIYVGGDSMESIYHDGQLIWVQKCSEILPGQVGIFLYDGDNYIKMYSERIPDNPEEFTSSDGVMHMQPVLVSFNKNYPDKIIRPGTDFRVFGRVL